ncbi:MAG: hypothetical protein J0H40_17715 [Rhizobiales bacterium]|nr:hypothetical protein [Hyphomicrobiales bacterium]
MRVLTAIHFRFRGRRVGCSAGVFVDFSIKMSALTCPSLVSIRASRGSRSIPICRDQDSSASHVTIGGANPEGEIPQLNSQNQSQRYQIGPGHETSLSLTGFLGLIPSAANCRAALSV